MSSIIHQKIFIILVEMWEYGNTWCQHDGIKLNAKGKAKQAFSSDENVSQIAT